MYLCVIDAGIAQYLSSFLHPPTVLHPTQVALNCRTNGGKSFKKSAESWIPRQSVACSILIVNKRTDAIGIVIDPVLMSSFKVAESRLGGISYGRGKSLPFFSKDTM